MTVYTPVYRWSLATMFNTLPTGSTIGSAAAIPVRTSTPDEVVEPLQYAVALNGSCVPVSGDPWLVVIAIRATLRESNICASYRNTKPAMATTSTTSFSHAGPERMRIMTGNARSRRGVNEGRIRL